MIKIQVNVKQLLKEKATNPHISKSGTMKRLCEIYLLWPFTINILFMDLIDHSINCSYKLLCSLF